MIKIDAITIEGLEEYEIRRCMVDPDRGLAKEIIRAIKARYQNQVYDQAKKEYEVAAASGETNLPIFTDRDAMNDWFSKRPAGKKTATELHIERTRPNLLQQIEQMGNQIVGLSQQKTNSELTESQVAVVDAQLASCRANKAEFEAQLAELDRLTAPVVKAEAGSV